MSKSNETPGFLDVLKNGKAREDAFKMMAPEELDNLSDEEVKKIVEGYVHSQHQSADYWRVHKLAEKQKHRLVPLLIEVIQQKGSELCAESEKKNVLHDSPLRRALAMLGQGEHPEILSRLIELSHHNDKQVRSDIAAHLTAFGSDITITPTLALLRDEEQSVQSSAIRGIETALKKKTISSAFRSALFEPLAHINRVGNIYSTKQGDLLILLDRTRATEVLVGLLPENRITSLKALEALNRASIPVDETILISLIEQNKLPIKKEPWRLSLFGNALIGLAKIEHPLARQMVDKILAEQPKPEEKTLRQFDNSRIRIQEHAVNALLVLEKFRMPSLWSRYDRLGRQGLGQIEQDLLSEADAEICNGGFSQYYFNINYDPREDIGTMKRIGAPEHAAILEKSLKAFGWRGPSNNRETRMDQLERMSEDKSSILDACDEAWFCSSESLDVLFKLYALKHRRYFESMDLDDPTEKP